MQNRQVYEADLRKRGLKITRHRLLILAVLDESDQPLAAEAVFSAIQKQRISISLSTVYRAVDMLVLHGLLTRLNITQDGRTLYEYNRRVHRHYLVCLECRTIMPIDGCPLAEYSQQLEAETGYKLSGHKLDLYGYCPRCLKNKHITPERQNYDT